MASWLDAGLPFVVKPWNQEMGSALLAARVAAVALGVLGFAISQSRTQQARSL